MYGFRSESEDVEANRGNGPKKRNVKQLNDKAMDWSIHIDRLPLKIDEPFCAIKLVDSPSVDKITACKT